MSGPAETIATEYRYVAAFRLPDGTWSQWSRPFTSDGAIVTTPPADSPLRLARTQNIRDTMGFPVAGREGRFYAWGPGQGIEGMGQDVPAGRLIDTRPDGFLGQQVASDFTRTREPRHAWR